MLTILLYIVYLYIGVILFGTLAGGFINAQAKREKKEAK